MLFQVTARTVLTHEADKRAHLDRQVNLLAEQEMTIVLRVLKELCDRFDVTETTHAVDVERHARQFRTNNAPSACVRDAYGNDVSDIPSVQADCTEPAR
jgi:uncharacterized membrane protein